MELDLSALTAFLNLFPLPALLVREGAVLCCNNSAKKCFPTCSPDMPVPPTLCAILETEGTLVCTLDGRSLAASSAPSPYGTLLVLRPLENTQTLPYSDRLSTLLRNQLNTLLIAAQKLGQADPPKDQELTAVLSQSTHRLLRVLNADSLTRRLANPASQWRKAPLDLVQLCRELTAQVGHLARELGLTFHFESDCGILPARANEYLLQQMLLSLLSNAMRATKPGGALGLKLESRKGKAVFTVWDKGSGMDEETLGSLFELEGTPFTPQRGLGVGLINAQRIAALHDGVLILNNREGDGVRVTVSIPVRPPEMLPVQAPRTIEDALGGYSPFLVEFSGLLPARAFLPDALSL